MRLSVMFMRTLYVRLLLAYESRVQLWTLQVSSGRKDEMRNEMFIALCIKVVSRPCDI